MRRLRRRWGRPRGASPSLFAVGPFEVAVGEVAAGYRVEIGTRPGAAGLPRDLVLRPRSSRTIGASSGPGPGLVISESCPSPLGEPAFDALQCLETPLAAALAWLTPAAVRGIVRAGGVDVRDGSLRCTVGAQAATRDEVVEALAGAVAVAQELARAAQSPPELELERGAREHRNPATRLKFLQALSDRFPGSPAQIRAFEAALVDPAPILRLEACRATGPAGAAGLWDLVRSPEVPESLRVAAVIALGRLDGALDSEPAQLADVLAARGSSALVAALLRTIQLRPARPWDAAFAVRALAARDDESFSAACALLGDRGDAEAARALREAARPRTLPAHLQRQAEHAAATIATRLAQA